MWLIFLVLVVIFLSLIAAIVAIVITIKNKNAWKAEPEITVNATVLGTYDEVRMIGQNSMGNESVDSFNSYEKKSYFVEFKTKDNTKKKFGIKKKEFLALNDGDVGVLKYKGDKMLSFIKGYSASSEESANKASNSAPAGKFFFQKEVKSGKTVKFYADAPDLDVVIPSNAPIDCDYDEICSFIDRIYENGRDNFFVLENEKGIVLQFSNTGRDEDIDVDVPSPENKGSYQGQFKSLSDVKSCVRSYFDNVDIPFNYALTLFEY